MAARLQATRAEAIAAAVDKFAGEDRLPDWETNECMNAVCAVLADTFGTDSPWDARDQIWREMSIQFERVKHRRLIEYRATNALRIARALADEAAWVAPQYREDFLDAMAKAAIEGMKFNGRVKADSNGWNRGEEQGHVEA